MERAEKMATQMYNSAKAQMEQAAQDWIESLNNQLLYVQPIKTIIEIDEPPSDFWDLLLSVFLGYFVETYKYIDNETLDDIPERFRIGSPIPHREGIDIKIDGSKIDGADALVLMDVEQTLLYMLSLE